MSYDEMQPYGPVCETTVRIATWNTWAQTGPWQEREPLLLAELAACAPDIVCLQEAWVLGEDSQAARFADALGMHGEHIGDQEHGGVISGHAVLSPWPFEVVDQLTFVAETLGSGGGAVLVRVAGPRGAIDVATVMLEYRLDLSSVRSAQLEELCRWLRQSSERENALVVCGDFNADPDSDEIRRLVGLGPVYAPNMVFYDAIDMAATGDLCTFSRRNPFAAAALYPERRLDHIFSQWPRAGGVGHPVHAGLLGDQPSNGLFASDHFGLFADLRY